MLSIRLACWENFAFARSFFCRISHVYFPSSSSHLHPRISFIDDFWLCASVCLFFVWKYHANKRFFLLFLFWWIIKKSHHFRVCQWWRRCSRKVAVKIILWMTTHRCGAVVWLCKILRFRHLLIFIIFINWLTDVYVKLTWLRTEQSFCCGREKKFFWLWFLRYGMFLRVFYHNCWFSFQCILKSSSLEGKGE